MQNLSENTMIVIVVAVVLLAAVIIMGRRLKMFRAKAGPIEASAEAGTPGANIQGNVIRGDLNKGTARGDNASLRGNRIEGSGNEFTADSGGGDQK